ncbi:MAG: DUF6323 family protein [Clostridium sp.]
MNKNVGFSLQQMQINQGLMELIECNELTIKYGLSLSVDEMRELIENRFKALRNNGRIEFGEGILKKLIEAFCDSPYLIQDSYKDVILELQESFYYFKKESMDIISDDELIEFMKRHFDGKCEGSLEYLSDTTLEELCRNTRYGFKTYDKEEF